MQLVAVFEPESYEKHRSNFEHTIQSLKFDLQREIITNGTNVKLSSRSQEYLIVNGENTYPANQSVIIIQEPHYDTQAQVNLFLGLRQLFSENDIASNTTFLAEGVFANETVSVAPLVQVAPDPLDDTVHLILSSFLVTGYIAYEWQQEKGIPIVGTEDPDLYDASAALWIARENKIWPITVAARNERMVQVLNKTLRSNKIPILFVGGLHLSSIEDVTLSSENIASSGILSTSAANKLSRAKKKGILQYLKEAGLGFIYLEPVSSLTLLEHKIPSERYRTLFQAQRSDHYQDYIKAFIEKYQSSQIASNPLHGGVTVKPSPQIASALLLDLQGSGSTIKREKGSGEKVSNDNGGSFWDKLLPWRGKTKTNGKSGKNRRYFEKDKTHNDLEGYDKRGMHKGSFDPDTGIQTKPAVPGRSIDT